MEDHDEGPRGMDNLSLTGRSFANQGNIRVDNITSDLHYHISPSPSPAPSQAFVSIGLPRDPNCVERLGLLEKLERMLPEGERHKPVALWGLTGTGYVPPLPSTRGCCICFNLGVGTNFGDLLPQEITTGTPLREKAIQSRWMLRLLDPCQ